MKRVSSKQENWKSEWGEGEISVAATRTKQELIDSAASGCGTLGRAVTFDTRDPWFESSHQTFSTVLKRRK